MQEGKGLFSILFVRPPCGTVVGMDLAAACVAEFMFPDAPGVTIGKKDPRLLVVAVSQKEIGIKAGVP